MRDCATRHRVARVILPYLSDVQSLEAALFSLPRSGRSMRTTLFVLAVVLAGVAVYAAYRYELKALDRKSKAERTKRIEPGI